MAIGLATLPSASLLFEYAKRNLVYGPRERTPTNYVTGKKLREHNCRKCLKYILYEESMTKENTPHAPLGKCSQSGHQSSFG